MKEVEKETKSDYEAYMNESDQEKKKKLKKEYSAKAGMMMKTEKFKKITQKYVDALTRASVAAAETVNDEISRIYADNYNQVAEDCRKAGIKVDGKISK